MQVYVAQVNPTVGDVAGNTQKVIRAIEEAKRLKADLALFPELVLCGYPPRDLLLLPPFIECLERGIQEVAAKAVGIIAIVGCVRRNEEGRGKPLFNSAAVLQNGQIVGYQDKSLLPTYDVFEEDRYFARAVAPLKTFTLSGKKIAITICEDIWEHAGLAAYPTDPILELKPQKPDLVLNLSASPFDVNKHLKRLFIAKKVVESLKCPFFLCNQVGGNDDLIFDGYSLALDSTGALVHYGKAFEEDGFLVDVEAKGKQVFLPTDQNKDLFEALVLGISDYFKKSGLSKAYLGLSGGIDSSLVACLAKEALGKENVTALWMPSRYSSKESRMDAEELVQNLGISSKTIDIDPLFEAFLTTLSPHFENRPFDKTEENLQARIRGMLLMAFSNKLGGVVLSTGNKSEYATGYATLYGDMCGGLAVISDLTKGQVVGLAEWINRAHSVIPKRILEKPPSAELRENQKDSDSLPPYDVVDAVLQDYVEGHLPAEKIADKRKIPLSVVQSLVKMIHVAEFKRRQGPTGLRVSTRSFSVGRRFPIVQGWV